MEFWIVGPQTLRRAQEFYFQGFSDFVIDLTLLFFVGS